MEKGYGQGDPRLALYVEEVFGDEDALLLDIRARAGEAGLPDIHVGPLDGLHLEVLARAFHAKRAVEIGTLAGYSGVRLMRGMGEGGRLDTFEFDPKHAAVAVETFRREGVADRVRVHVGPAAEDLPAIEADGPFDLVFIDADKDGYPGYLEWAARNLRVGGVVLGDNAFLFGGVAEDPDRPTDGASGDRIRAMRAFNHTLARGGRFRATMLPTGEGLALGVKLR